MNHMKGVVITGQNAMIISENCPLPEEPYSTGAFARNRLCIPALSSG